MLEQLGCTKRRSIVFLVLQYVSFLLQQINPVVVDLESYQCLDVES